MIEVNKLYVSLNEREILSNINFKLEDSNNLVILGRSGSGKTVLIKTLLGIYYPASGNVIIDGSINGIIYSEKDTSSSKSGGLLGKMFK